MKKPTLFSTLTGDMYYSLGHGWVGMTIKNSLLEY